MKPLYIHIHEDDKNILTRKILSVIKNIFFFEMHYIKNCKEGSILMNYPIDSLVVKVINLDLIIKRFKNLPIKLQEGILVDLIKKIDYVHILLKGKNFFNLARIYSSYFHYNDRYVKYVGIDKLNYNVVMENINGITLFYYLSNYNVTVCEVKYIIIQGILTIILLYQNGLYHNDLNGGNILLTKNNRKILYIIKFKSREHIFIIPKEKYKLKLIDFSMSSVKYPRNSFFNIDKDTRYPYYDISFFINTIYFCIQRNKNIQKDKIDNINNILKGILKRTSISNFTNERFNVSIKKKYRIINLVLYLYNLNNKI